jgi:CRISPR-associated endonuclease Csn1
VTAILRNNWKLNKLLSQENAKTRLDHRHHAIDALVIALTNERAIQLINKSASRGDFKYENRFSNIEIIWPDLLEQTKINVIN